MATAVNIIAFLMQEQGDCSPLTLDNVTTKPGCGLESECGTGRKKNTFARLRMHFGHPPISNPGSTPAWCVSLLSSRV